MPAKRKTKDKNRTQQYPKKKDVDRKMKVRGQSTAKWFKKLLYATPYSSATLTEVFPCFFLSCKANAMVKLAKTVYGPHSSKLVVICVVLCIVCVLTQLQLTNISISIVILCGLFHDAVSNSDERTCNVRTIGGWRTGKDVARKWSWPKWGIMSECSSRECILDSWWPGCNWKLAVSNNLLDRQHYYNLLCQLVAMYYVSSHCFCQFIFVWPHHYKPSVMQCQITW